VVKALFRDRRTNWRQAAPTFTPNATAFRSRVAGAIAARRVVSRALSVRGRSCLRGDRERDDAGSGDLSRRRGSRTAQGPVHLCELRDACRSGSVALESARKDSPCWNHASTSRAGIGEFRCFSRESYRGHCAGWRSRLRYRSSARWRLASCRPDIQHSCSQFLMFGSSPTTESASSSSREKFFQATAN